MEKTSVCGSKTWDDADDQDGKRPESIVIDLFADDVFLDSRTVSAADGWAWAFEDLNKYDQDRLIVYSIREEPVPEYQSQVDGYNVTNRHVPLKISIPVKKTWIGPALGSVTVELLANGNKTAEAVLKEENGWQYTFADCSQCSNGKDILYTIREVPAEGYSSTVIDQGAEGFEIVNTNLETVQIPVEKRWRGPAAKAVTVRLLADGAVIESAELTERGEWKHVFTGLKKYDPTDGHEIEYRIAEEPMEHYTAVITGDSRSGFVITNTKKATPPPGTPQTGDETHLRLYFLTMVLSGVGLVFAAAFVRNRSRQTRN